MNTFGHDYSQWWEQINLERYVVDVSTSEDRIVAVYRKTNSRQNEKLPGNWGLIHNPREMKKR